MKILLGMILLISQSALSLECKVSQNKKFEHLKSEKIFNELKKQPNQKVFEYFLYGITTPDYPKKLIKIYLKYLESSVQDKDVLGFLDIVKFSSQLGYGSYTPLELQKVCELFDKVQSLKRDPASKAQKSF